jgi:hypothetical protein
VDDGELNVGGVREYRMVPESQLGKVLGIWIESRGTGESDCSLFEMLRRCPKMSTAAA